MYWCNVYIGGESKKEWPTHLWMNYDGRVAYTLVSLIWLAFVENSIFNDMNSQVVGLIERIL